MKKLVFIGILALIISACATNEKISTAAQKSLEAPVITEDSTEYEVVISDPGFDYWFLRFDNESSIRSLSYYKSWNQRYVSDWNTRITEHYRGFETETNLYIDVYNINDLAVQHKLFYYFQFVERHKKIKIIYGVSPR